MSLIVDASDGEITQTFKLTDPDIANLLSFNNANGIAYLLYHRDATIAIALYEELGFWLRSKEEKE